MGWGVAIVLGWLAPGLILISLTFLAEADGPETLVFALIALAPGSLVIASLGIAVARALRTHRSAVPGVQRLVTAVNDVCAEPRDHGRAGISAEVAPASAPAGRGDEPTPAA
jgi:hypothetical protein